MPLVELVYLSRRNAAYPLSEYVGIAEKSQKNNHQHGITGLLCFNKGVFLQVIEGEALEINSLYAKILSDMRHSELCLVHYDMIQERRFSQWGMQFVNLSDLLGPDQLREEYLMSPYTPFPLEYEPCIKLLLRARDAMKK